MSAPTPEAPKAGADHNHDHDHQKTAAPETQGKAAPKAPEENSEPKGAGCGHLVAALLATTCTLAVASGLGKEDPSPARGKLISTPQESPAQNEVTQPSPRAPKDSCTPDQRKQLTQLLRQWKLTEQVEGTCAENGSLAPQTPGMPSAKAWLQVGGSTNSQSGSPQKKPQFTAFADFFQAVSPKSECAHFLGTQAATAIREGDSLEVDSEGTQLFGRISTDFKESCKKLLED